jgi:hypothetical protein
MLTDGPLCSFDAILKKYNLKIAALRRGPTIIPTFISTAQTDANSTRTPGLS